MNNQEGYNNWAATYDTVANKTRDLEAEVLRKILTGRKFNHILEAGCGTGKNTRWLASLTNNLTAFDLSEEMMDKARKKVSDTNVTFQQVDLTQSWPELPQPADLIVSSLVLEHIEHLDFIFKQANIALANGGLFYICELHPFKQYSGSKARYETDERLVVLKCFTHHLSDFIKAAGKQGFSLTEVDEWFDTDRQNEIPRLVSFVFRKI
ncbi:methyltransferase domain-containing protein [Fulvivirga sp. 29W222]|uniref:Methyltransferase domain-containing protein n=1 Tax=Fulvivirga marina TaxID=2494733 RepID=A0A937FXI1_9BACT|nr:class I SAM-dependent methyltransferase [Fulvivirga marina]MBL6447985.1 methyltransferase domain-containing protein [Fulvivirga marina]